MPALAESIFEIFLLEVCASGGRATIDDESVRALDT